MHFRHTLLATILEILFYLYVFVLAASSFFLTYSSTHDLYGFTVLLALFLLKITTLIGIESQVSSFLAVRAVVKVLLPVKSILSNLDISEAIDCSPKIIEANLKKSYVDSIMFLILSLGTLIPFPGFVRSPAGLIWFFLSGWSLLRFLGWRLLKAKATVGSTVNRVDTIIHSIMGDRRLDPKFITQVFRSLSEDNIDTISLIALNPTTEEDVLKELSENKQYKIRVSVAQNISTPSSILKKFLDDPVLHVRDAARITLDRKENQ